MINVESFMKRGAFSCRFIKAVVVEPQTTGAKDPYKHFFYINLEFKVRIECLKL